MNTMRSTQIEVAPAPAYDVGAPVINGPAVLGASPGKPLLYLIPALGERPLRFSALNLPDGLFLDTEQGIISGSTEAGITTLQLTAENKLGRAEKNLTLVIKENSLALTPPMGWNSWNCYRSEIDEEKIMAIARGMITSGLAARGYSYVNLDSGWQSSRRGGKFNSIIPHAGFPDMAALCRRVHELGLKIGIYSGPYVTPWGTEGCGSTSGLIDTRYPAVLSAQVARKFIGLNKHEEEDARQWAEWGFDYVKYDWAHTDMETAARMSRALRATDRDMVFSITTNVNIKDAQEAARLCNLWRSNNDTAPTWQSLLHNGFGNEAWNSVIGPGQWFDLDMTAIKPRDGSSLTKDELVTCITCWAIRPSPLLIDCIPNDLDDFTRSVLCNEETIAVNQDAWGLPAGNVTSCKDRPIQAKPLSTGGMALAFYNLTDEAGNSPEVDVSALGFEKPVSVRDLWARRDLAGLHQKLSVALPPHGAKLFLLK